MSDLVKNTLLTDELKSVMIWTIKSIITYVKNI